jgi:hypothetical protein
MNEEAATDGSGEHRRLAGEVVSSSDMLAGEVVASNGCR